MSNDNGIQDISDKFLNYGDLFGIEFNEGFVFLEVNGWNQPNFEPFDGFSQVSASSNLGFEIPEDPDNNGDEILYVDSGETKVIHAGVGHNPSILRRYTRYGDHTLRPMPNIGTPSSSNGDDFGYVDGKTSPYQNPTDIEELLVVPNTSIYFDFYNPDPNQAHSPIMNFQMRVYKVSSLDPTDSNDLNAIKRIVSRGSPMPIFPAGSIDAKVGYTLSSDWGVDPLSQSRIRQIRNGNFNGGSRR